MVFIKRIVKRFVNLIPKRNFPQGMEKNSIKKKMTKRDRIVRFIRRRKACLKKHGKKVIFCVLGAVIVSGTLYLILQSNSFSSPFGVRKRVLMSIQHKTGLGKKLWKNLPKQLRLEHLLADSSSSGQKPAAPQPNNNPNMENQEGYYKELFAKGIVLAPGLISVSHGLTHMAQYYAEGDRVSSGLLLSAVLQEGLYCLMLASDCKPRPPRSLLLFPLFNKILVVKYRSFRRGDIVTLKELYGW